MKHQLYMKTQYLFPIILLIVAACGGSEGDKNLEAKKAELDKARAQLQEVKGKITELEKEISELDPEFARQITKAILVSTFVAEKKPFEHKVDVRGAVESRRNVFLSA
ncbi:MAG: efflux RND transporter periplasmic adaptor subunit, partial [Cyclobacteriaceae bacterium]